MKPLLSHCFRHLYRSKIVLVLIVAVFLIQLIGLKLHQFIATMLQQQATFLPPETLANSGAVTLLILHGIAGTLVTLACGVWIVPYLHTEERVPLTFTLPVSPFTYLLSYLATVFCLHGLLLALALGSHYLISGSDAFVGFTWKAFLCGVGMEWFAFAVMLLLVATLCIWIGKLLGFFVVLSSSFVLSLAESVAKVGLRAPEPASWVEMLDKAMWVVPPVAKLPFHIYLAFQFKTQEIWIWAIWLLLSGGAFLWLLK